MNERKKGGEERRRVEKSNKLEEERILKGARKSEKGRKAGK